jgi:hypothetical protein
MYPKYVLSTPEGLDIELPRCVHDPEEAQEKT